MLKEQSTVSNMSKKAQSKASERHIAAVAVKEDLVSEIQHWLKSSGGCIDEIQDTLNTLRNARALAKRDIHMVRASIELKLKALEVHAESQLSSIVKAEEDKLTKSKKKLVDQKQKLEVSEANLQKNSAGLELKRYIEEARQHLDQVRQSIIINKRSNRPTAVEFSMHNELLPFVNGERCLGTVQVRSNNGAIIRSSGDQEMLKAVANDNKKKTNDAVTNKANDKKCIPLRKTNQKKSRLDNSLEIINDFEKLLQSDVNDVTTALSSTDRTKGDIETSKTHKCSHPHIGAKIEARKDCQSTPRKGQDHQRSKSAKTRNAPDNGRKLDTRLTTSARDDSRPLPQQARNDYKPVMKYLNNTEFAPHEEQGPEHKLKTKTNKKEKLSVSYAKFDTVKEISSLPGDKMIEKPYRQDAFVDIFAHSEAKRVLSSASSGSNKSLSSVSYKPSNAYASGPVTVPDSEIWQSKSQFMYTARFHTKKHPEDTDLCRLTGIVVLGNGQVVIADINHLKVMLFGPDFTYLSDIECPSPCGVCVVNKDIVATTLFHNRKLLLLKVCMLHLERYKEIHVHCPETLYAVKYSNNYFHVLCFAGHVHVVDNTGKEMTLIETHIGNGMARNLEMNARRNVLYITGMESVKCFYNTGDICWQFTAKTKNRNFNPGGIVLHNDRLFVTDWGNHRVLELSPDGTFVRDVIVDNLDFPHAMAVQNSTGRLFITQSNMFKQEARSRSVKVFSIK